MTNTNDKRPTHIVYQVIDSEKEGGKPFFMRIGAAWPHRKDTGLNVQLDAAPLRGRVVIMERKDDESDAAPDAGDQE